MWAMSTSGHIVLSEMRSTSSKDFKLSRFLLCVLSCFEALWDSHKKSPNPKKNCPLSSGKKHLKNHLVKKSVLIFIS